MPLVTPFFRWRLQMAVAVLALSGVVFSPLLSAQIAFRNVVTGGLIDLEDAQEEGRDTEAVKHFLQSGNNIYNNNPACLKEGESLFLTACSACHGHHAEGKIGPSLTDDYWTYLEGQTDDGFFSIIFGGARASMGPQYLALTLDEMLLIMSWIRHMYHGDLSTADWMTDEDRAAYKPYELNQELVIPEGASCKH
ncbi:MAG: cytochrome c(L), periplasmic [Parahaliea sp.]